MVAHLHGVSWDDLKYAIRVDTIIQAIATNYGIILLVMISLQVQIHLTTICLCGCIERKGGVPVDNLTTATVSGNQVGK